MGALFDEINKKGDHITQNLKKTEKKKKDEKAN